MTDIAVRTHILLILRRSLWIDRYLANFRISLRNIFTHVLIRIVYNYNTRQYIRCASTLVLIFEYKHQIIYIIICQTNITFRILQNSINELLSRGFGFKFGINYWFLATDRGTYYYMLFGYF